MTLASLHQFLVLYLWFGLVALLLFWALIARFYQRFAKYKTRFFLYTAPALLIGAVAIRSASLPIGTYDALDDFLLGLGGVVFLALTIPLYRRMMRKS